MSPQSIRLHASPRAVRISDATLRELGQRAPQAPGTDSPAGEAQAARPSVDAQAAAQIQSLMAALAERTQELEAAHKRLEEELPAFAVELSVGIARELLRTEIGAGNYSVEAIVRKALAVASTGRSSCTIHLHPDDLETCDPSRFRSNTTFEADPDIARGDVHVATPQGMLVHDIDAALTRVREELLEATR